MANHNVVVNFDGRKYSSTIDDGWKDKIKTKFSGSRNAVSNKLTTSWNNAKKRRGSEAIIKAVGQIQSSDRYKSLNARLSNQLNKLSIEANNDSFWKTVAGEFFGSLFFLIFTGGTTFKVGIYNSVMATSLCSGFCYIALLFCFGKGGHFNASVSIGMAWAGCIKKRDAFVRIVSQFAGNFCGSIILNRLSSSSPEYIGINSVAFGVTRFKAFLGECLSTMIFVFIFLFCYNKHASRGILAIGAILTAILIFIIPYTGGCLNPSRSLGTAIASNFWAYQWIFLSAPTFGGILAGCLYKSITTNLILKSFEKFYTCLNRKKQVDIPKSESHSIDEILSSKMSTFSDIFEMTSPKYDLKMSESHSDEIKEESYDESSDEEYSQWDVLPHSMKAKCANKSVHWSPNIGEDLPIGNELANEINTLSNENDDEQYIRTDFCEPITDHENFTIFSNVKASLRISGDDVIGTIERI